MTRGAVSVFDFGNSARRSSFGTSTESPRSWHDDAICKGLDPEEAARIFFPQRGTRIDEAVTYCCRCPVADACLDEAQAKGDWWGVRGGVSEDGRRQMRAARRRLRLIEGGEGA